MATEKLCRDTNNTCVISTDTTKPLNAKLKAQGWVVTASAATNPASGKTL